MIPSFLLNTGSSTITFVEAQQSNNHKLIGRARNEAAFLVELKDSSLLAQQIAGLATDRIKRRSISGFVKKVYSQYENFNLTLDIYVINEGILLPSNLSKSNQHHFEALFDVKDVKLFEKAFVKVLYDILFEMQGKIERQLKEDVNPVLQKLLLNHAEIIKDQMQMTSLFHHKLKRAIKTKNGDILPPK